MLLALDGSDLNTVHELSSNEKISRPRFEPKAAGCEARTLSIVLRGPLSDTKHVSCSSLIKLVNAFKKLEQK